MRTALALYEPDIAQNVGTTLRTAVCLAVPVHIIHPCGFAFSARSVRRAGMDYLDHVEVVEHDDWDAFAAWATGERRRLVLLTTQASVPYAAHRFEARDVLLMGRESAGVPPHVHASADARLAIPMALGRRSLNVAVAAGMVLGEALRQQAGFPAPVAGGTDPGSA